MLVTDDVRDREEAALAELMKMSNWGRWGADDERGAANHLTADVVRRASTYVRTGTVYPLATDIRSNNTPIVAGRPAPQHLMALDGGDFAAGAMPGRTHQVADDFLILAPHGSTTHVDALCHVWFEHAMYNGFSGNLVRSYGALKLGVENIGGVVTRGVLLDIPRYRGVEELDGREVIVADDITGCIEQLGIAPIQAGDAVLIRTGCTRVYFRDPDAYSRSQAGLAPSGALTLARWDVSVIGCDNVGVQAHDGVAPGSSHIEGGDRSPRAGLDLLHVPLLRNLGIYLLEMLDLETLAREEIKEFMFCMAPLRIKGGTASPVNPLAVT